jgi:prepilin-type N-terminal cleavage/methylation domain-containing protein
MPSGRAAAMPMEVHMRQRGFAFVEIAVGLVVLAIVASIVIMAVSKPSHTGAVVSCQQDAKAFEQSVHDYYYKHHEQAWPSKGAHGSVYAIAIALIGFGGLDGSHNVLAHLDGSQRTPVTTMHGWKYDFAHDRVDASGCLSAS